MKTLLSILGGVVISVVTWIVARIVYDRYFAEMVEKAKERSSSEGSSGSEEEQERTEQ